MGGQLAPGAVESARIKRPMRQCPDEKQPGRFDQAVPRKLAEGVGFEPTVAQKTTTVFETAPFGRSGTPPRIL